MRPSRTCAAAALAMLCGPVPGARAEPVTPWSVARTVHPDVPPPDAVARPATAGPAVPVPGTIPDRPAPRPWTAQVPADPVPPELNPLADGRLAALTAVRERPLFAPARRPPRPVALPVVQAPVEPVAVAVAPPPPDLRLLGIVEGPEAAAGLLRRPSGATLTVRQGDLVDGWTVGAIGPGRLSLTAGERSQTYLLFATKSAGTPPRRPPPDL